MSCMNKKLKGVIADANSDSQNERMLREKLEYFIRRYYDELTARSELHDAYNKLFDFIKPLEVLLKLSCFFASAAITLSLINFLI